MLDICRTHCLHIVNGRTLGDEEGHFTCVSNNGHSVVNYALVTSKLFDFVSDFSVGNLDESDHFPIHCVFQMFNNDQSRCDSDMYVLPYYKFLWDDKFRDAFRQLMTDEYTRTKLADIICEIDTDIDTTVEMIISLYERGVGE